jgi:DNA-binding XRE family transcriptional regulator
MTGITQTRTYARGEKVGASKLTEEQVHEIRATKGVIQKELAEKFGVSRATINRIIKRKAWAHV